MFETPPTQPIKENEKNDAKKNELLESAIKKALDSLAHYKEMPDVKLESDPGISYKLQDPDEVEAKRPNKYRKVAFATIGNYLYLIMMHIKNKDTFSERLDQINDEIAASDSVTKDMIDRFDALAYEIIDAGKKEINQE